MPSKPPDDMTAGGKTEKSMSEPVTNELILERLESLQSGLAELKSDMRDIRHCLGSLASGQASLSKRVDRLVDRLERFERRSWWQRPPSDD